MLKCSLPGVSVYYSLKATVACIMAFYIFLLLTNNHPEEQYCSLPRRPIKKLESNMQERVGGWRELEAGTLGYLQNKMSVISRDFFPVNVVYSICITKDMISIPVCRKDLDQLSGSFSSPNYPNPSYYYGDQCVWKIRPPSHFNTSMVWITFTQFLVGRVYRGECG